MLIVGLTGSFGAGKSLALRAFGELGAFTVDSDRVVAELLGEKTVLNEIKRLLGPSVFDAKGQLVKERAARMVFMDQGARAKLEGLLHPLVFARIEELLKDADAELAVIEVPLLFEGGYERRFQKTVSVYADFHTILRRLTRKGVSRNDVYMRQACQMSAEEKARRADYSIDNNGSESETMSQVKALYEKLTTPAGHDGRGTRVLHGLEGIRKRHSGAVLTIGNFDGVHLGHQKIISTVTQRAKELGTGTIAITFEPHPVKVLLPERELKLLTPPDEKARMLLHYGIGHVLFINFTREFASQQPEDFIKDVIVDKLGAKAVIVGHNYTFGKGRRGTTDLLRRWGRKLGFEVKVVRNARMSSDVISSSRIRGLISRGSVLKAAELLGRAYCIHGTVVEGAGRGATSLGTPTANISTPHEMVPKKGVYAVKALLEGKLHDGVANIGENPTFNTPGVGAMQSYEVHIFDFKKDIRGKDLRVFFVSRLRDEKAFPGVDELKEQIEKDIVAARDVLEGKKLKGMAFI